MNLLDIIILKSLNLTKWCIYSIKIIDKKFLLKDTYP